MLSAAFHFHNMTKPKKKVVNMRKNSRKIIWWMAAAVASSGNNVVKISDKHTDKVKENKS